MEITHLFSPAMTGGLERVVEMLAVGQRESGHRVSAIAIVGRDAPEPPVLGRLRNAGVPVRPVMSAGRSYPAERAGFRQELQRQSPGLLHTHGYRADVLHAPVARDLGFALVSTLHGFTGGDLKMRFYEFLQQRACRRFDRVVAVSLAIAEHMRRTGVSNDRLRVIPNAYSPMSAVMPRAEARARLGMKPDGFAIGYVGRLSHEKGPDVLVSALGRLRHLPLTFVCVGDGPEAPKLLEQAQALGVADMIQWVRGVDGVSSMFSAFDVFALGSRTEGTPIVLFEAATAQVPIVCTAVGGVPDVFDNSQALLVPPESPAAIAEAIESVFIDRDAARERATRAGSVVRERFALAPWVRRYDDIYDEAMRARHAPN